MKNLLLLFIIIPVFSYSQVNLQNGLVAKYQFNQSLNDSGPNNLNATGFGGPTYINDRNNNQNSAISLDGIDDHIKIANNSLFDFSQGNFSISFWVKKQVSSAQSPSYQNSFGVNQWGTGGATSGQND